MEKITNSVQEFIEMPSNAKKLSNLANSAKKFYPNKGAEFAHAERNFKKSLRCGG